jgi:aspartate/methionine/tyrosine aminotransferase
MPGVPALREAIAEKTARLQNRNVDADLEITVSSGATEGLFSAIQAVVRPGDEVIVLRIGNSFAFASFGARKPAAASCCRGRKSR